MTFAQILKILAFYGRFLPSFTQPGYLARRLLWPRFAPSFAGQHWLVTGGSGGLGRAMVFAALRGGAAVTAVARDAGRLRQLEADAAAAGLTGAGGGAIGRGRLDTEVCDLTSVAATGALIGRLAARWSAEGRRIDVLMGNVGVLQDALVVTPEGHEASFVSNLLSHHQLVEALIGRGLLTRGAAVVEITSGGAYTVPLSTAMLDVTDPVRYNGTAAYTFHKRAQISLVAHWREAHRGRGIAFYAMHPGWVDTAGVQRSLPRFRRLLRPLLRDERSGADTAVWLAAARPAQPAGEWVWFDRRPRAAHVYAHTRAARDTPDSLAAFLSAKLAAHGV